MDRNMDMDAEWRDDYTDTLAGECECWKDDRYMYGCPHEVSDRDLVEDKIRSWVTEWENRALRAMLRPRHSPIAPSADW